MEDRAYEISLNLDGFYWSACTKETIFGNCKKRVEERIKCSDKVKMKEFKDKGFTLNKRRSL